MSVLVPVDAKTVPAKVKLTTTSATAVYVARSGITAKLLTLRLVNTDASNACPVAVTIFDDSESATYTWVPTNNLAASGYVEFDFGGFRLDASDELRVTAGNANDIECFAVVAEVQGKTAR